MGADQGGGAPRRRVGAGAGELPLLDDPLALLARTFSLVPPREQALFFYATLNSPLRPLPQRILLRSLPPLSSRRRPPRRPRTRPCLRLVLSLSPQLQRLPRLPGLVPFPPQF